MINLPFINTISPVSPNSFKELEKLISYKIISKNELFIQHHQKNKYEYFLLDGYARSFINNENGEEITISFYKSPSVLSPHITRTKNDLSILNFQALTEIKIGIMDAELFLKLMISNLEIREFGNSILKNELLQKVDKEIGLASLPAKDRLIQFRKQYALLENLIAHPIIASYLGITNISLSRLRKDLSKK